MKTYAYIDEGSDAAFCTKSLQEHLGIPGRKATLEVETLTDTKTVHCKEVRLEVSDIDCQNLIKLPKVYAHESIPADMSDAIKQEDIAEFSYLDHVQLPDIQDTANVHVGLLIGNNVPSATEHLEIVNSQDGGPYAVRTALG